MMRYLLFFICSYPFCEVKAGQLIIDFYGQKLTLEYSESLYFKDKLKAKERDLVKFYETILKSDYEPLVRSLRAYKKQVNLNDWLYYTLIEKTCVSIDPRTVNSSYLKWFILGKEGYRVWMTFSKRHALIFVESDEIVSGLQKWGRNYCLNCDELDLPTHSLSKYNPFRNNNKKFSFYFNPLPSFDEKDSVIKTFYLKLPGDSVKEVKVQFGKALMSALRERRNFSMYQTFSVPISESVNNLLNEISNVIKDYSDSLKVEYITTFTRKNSSYLTDQDQFSREKWMTPEEYLYYGSGDCEDRSSFIFYALKEILKKPLVIIDYPNNQHLNIGINLTLKMKPNFYYKKKPYYVIEPTVVSGHIPLGMDDLVKTSKYEIIGEDNPIDSK